MKIAHITNTLFSFEFMIGNDQIKLLEKFGHDVMVLTDTKNRVLGKDGPKKSYNHIGFNNLTVKGIILNLMALKKSFKTQGFEMIITHTIEASFYSLLVASFSSKAQKIYCRHGVAWLTGNLFKRSILFFVDLICCILCDKIIDVSRGVRFKKPFHFLFLKKSYLLGSGSLIGVNIPEIEHSVSSKRSLTLGYVSRLTDEKGIPSLIEFAQLIKSRGLENRVVLFGPKDSSTTYLFPDNVEYCGVELDKDIIYTSFDVLLNFSKREGLSTVVLEAGAYGIPTIGFNVIGIRDCVVEGQTGYLVTNLEDALNRFVELDTDRVIFKKVCLEARLFVKNKFDRQIKVKEFVNLLNLPV